MVSRKTAHCTHAWLPVCRIAFESDPDAFMAKVEPEQQALRQKVLDARSRLRDVKVPMQLQVRDARPWHAACGGQAHNQAPPRHHRSTLSMTGTGLW